MTQSPIKQDNASQWTIGNSQFEMVISLTEQGLPVITRLNRTGDGTNWAPASGGIAFESVVATDGVLYQPGSADMSFTGAVAGITSSTQPRTELRLNYRCRNGLEISHHIYPSP